MSVAGGHFPIEPTSLLRQERTCIWGNDFTPVSNALPQPSLVNSNKIFHSQYCELKQFDEAIEKTDIIFVSEHDDMLE